MSDIDLFDLRVSLVSASPYACMKWLDRPHITVCDVLSSPAHLLARIAREQPHILLFMDPVPNFSSLCGEVTQAVPCNPPRIIACFDTACEAVDAKAVLPSRTGDAACEQMLLSLDRAMAAPVGNLALPSFPARIACSEALLSALEMPAALLGRHSVALGAVWLSALPYPAPPIQRWLYPHLAAEQGTTPAAIERRIRSAIEATWLCGSMQAQGELFGMTVSAERGKPTNAEFLYMLTEHIRNRLFK